MKRKNEDFSNVYELINFYSNFEDLGNNPHLIFRKELASYLDQKKITELLLDKVNKNAVLVICEVLKTNTTIQNLKFLNQNIFTKNVEALALLWQALSLNSNVKLLHFCDNTNLYDYLRVKIIAEGLKKNKGIVDFKISVEHDAAAPIVKAVKNHPTIRILDCNDVFFAESKNHYLMNNSNIVSLSSNSDLDEIAENSYIKQDLEYLISKNRNLYEIDFKQNIKENYNNNYLEAAAKLLEKVVFQSHSLEKITGLGFSLNKELITKLNQNKSENTKFIDLIRNDNIDFSFIENRKSTVSMNHIIIYNGMHKIGKSLIEFKLLDTIYYTPKQKIEISNRLLAIEKFGEKHLFHIKGICKQDILNSYSFIQKKISEYLEFSGKNGILNTPELTTEEKNSRNEIKFLKQKFDKAQTALDLANQLMSIEQYTGRVISADNFKLFQNLYSNSSFQNLDHSIGDNSLGKLWQENSLDDQATINIAILGNME